MSRRRLAVTAVAALVVLLASIAVGRSFISSPPTTTARDQPPATAPAPAASQAPLPEGFVSFNESELGFSVASPCTWKRLASTDEEVRLLVADGTKVSLLVRVAPVGLTVTEDTLGLVRDLTDSLVRANPSVKLLSEPQPIALDDAPGYRYLYTFGAGGGRRGAHLHFLVFRRKRLIQLVFQVPGVRALEREADLLDRIAGTFVAAP